MRRWYLVVCFLIITSLAVGACKSKETQKRTTPKPKQSKSTQEKKSKDGLQDESQEKLQMPSTVDELQLAFEVGDTVSDFTLKDTDGNEVTLYELLKDKPLVLEFGSYTCPPFRESVADTESLYARYKDRVNFLLVYVIDAHPAGSKSPYKDSEWTMSYSKDLQGDPVTQPQTYGERVERAQACIKDGGITIPVVVDKMDNSVWQTFGPAPNLAYLIGTDKKVVVAQKWYSPRDIERAITNYLGR